MNTLRQAAQALCDRWDTALWKDVAHTAVFIGELREAIAREEAQGVEPATEDVVSGALFDFLGYCTSRNEELHLSGHHDAGKAVDALRDWAKTRSLNLDEARVKDWQLFTHPAPAKPSAGEREELMQALRFFSYDIPAANAMMRKASDMLAADAQEIAGWRVEQRENMDAMCVMQKEINDLKAQQVAVPQEPMAFLCHGNLYPWPSEDDYCGNPEDHIPLYAAPQPPQADEPCYCDKQGIGKPGVTCGDCPRDYSPPPTNSQKSGDAHEIWAAAQLVPGEGIADGVARVEALLGAPRVPMTEQEIEDACPRIDDVAFDAGFENGIRFAEAHHEIGVKK